MCQLPSGFDRILQNFYFAESTILDYHFSLQLINSIQACGSEHSQPLVLLLLFKNISYFLLPVVVRPFSDSLDSFLFQMYLIFAVQIF